MKDEKRVVSSTVRQPQPPTSPSSHSIQMTIDTEFQPPKEFYDVFSVTSFDKPSHSLDAASTFNSHQNNNSSQVNSIKTTSSNPSILTTTPHSLSFGGYEYSSEENNSTSQQRPQSGGDDAIITMRNPTTAIDFPSMSDSSMLIFSPPNSVPIEQRLITQPDKSTYIAPIKAAGDVSLNGLQLVSFLTKASLRLKEGSTQEGVQVRLNKLHENVTHNMLSEASLKKLNYIVDEIDRELYDEAWTDFEQFVIMFPNEAAGWSQGVRIMLIELRRTAHRKYQHRGNSAELSFETIVEKESFSISNHYEIPGDQNHGSQLDGASEDYANQNQVPQLDVINRFAEVLAYLSVQEAHYTPPKDEIFLDELAEALTPKAYSMFCIFIVI